MGAQDVGVEGCKKEVAADSAVAGDGRSARHNTKDRGKDGLIADDNGRQLSTASHVWI